MQSSHWSSRTLQTIRPREQFSRIAHANVRSQNEARRAQRTSRFSAYSDLGQSRLNGSLIVWRGSSDNVAQAHRAPGMAA
jgi:hypothetical protein